jgi:hypothetical protein
VRIESALAVKRITVGSSLVLLRHASDWLQTRMGFNGDVWLGFERLTCVPIQTKMVKESMLTKDEKQWIKVRLSFALQQDAQPSRYILSRTTTSVAVRNSSLI